MKAVGKWVLIEIEQQETDSGIITGDGNKGRIVSYGGQCCFVADLFEGVVQKMGDRMFHPDEPTPPAIFQNSEENPFIGAECYFNSGNAVDIQGLKCVKDENVYCIIPMMPEAEMGGIIEC
jgi:hypothetical protein